MKLRANRKNLKTYAKELLGNNWDADREKALIKECLTGFVRDPHRCHISHDRAAHIARIDKILGNCGCEGFLCDKHGNDMSGNCSMDGVKWDVQYSNTGDSYGMTILYVNGKLCIGDWGSLFE